MSGGSKDACKDVELVSDNVESVGEYRAGHEFPYIGAQYTFNVREKKKLFLSI